MAVAHAVGTACLGLFRDTRLRPGDTVIVGGGAGGVGFAISNAAAGDLAIMARIISSRLSDGTLRPRIGARMPLTAAAQAHRRQEAGHASGRIIVLP